VLTDTSRTLFISDLHLCASRSQTTRIFLDFLEGPARGAQALYVLGDLFEYWAGDDDLDDPHHQQVCAAFRNLVESGTRIAFMHGNRDFLIGDAFAKASGMILLSDPFLTDIHGKRVLLTHGDTLCTDDLEYQQFRRQVRDPVWQKEFLAQPLESRKAQIEALRKRSESEKSYKSEAIMDVNQQAVVSMLRQHGHPEMLIHGHTHRPGRHTVQDAGHVSTRWVLGDWYESGDYLCCTEDACERFPVA
jgi:UDP-2,3-diacylglucosamine hydrolase